MKIFVSGSLAYDRIMDFPGKFEDHILPDKIHVLNVCFTVNGLAEKFGGTAGNIAYSLALLAERPLILGAAGKDFDKYEEWLLKQGLSLEGVRRIPEEFTAGAYITTDKRDNQITGFNPGAMKFPSLFNFDGAGPDKAIVIISPNPPRPFPGTS
jgi:adenosine kinase